MFTSSTVPHSAQQTPHNHHHHLNQPHAHQQQLHHQSHQQQLHHQPQQQQLHHQSHQQQLYHQPQQQQLHHQPHHNDQHLSVNQQFANQALFSLAQHNHQSHGNQQHAPTQSTVPQFLDANQHLIAHFNQPANGHFVDGISIIETNNNGNPNQITSNIHNVINHHSNNKISNNKGKNVGAKTRRDKSDNIRNTESPRRIFSCPTCCKGFTEKFNMKRHMQIHSQSRPKYICNECSKSFAWKDNFIRHKKAVHGTNLQQYQV